MIKKISILGSTGSIGRQTLEVIKENPHLFEVEALACGNNIELLEEQIKSFNPVMVSVSKEEDAIKLQKKYPYLSVNYGREGLIDVARGNCHMVVSSLMGMIGLEPTYEAIKAGKDIAFANKETLVTGGKLIMDAVKEYQVNFLPVDSEHSAIFQCLEGNKDRKIKRILLTASGGPFRGYDISQLENVSLEQALKHPNWSMGAKITVDSASMMNKGLEIIEAKWLFDLEPEIIQVLVHPQSIVHSAVEFCDNSVIAQMGKPTMKTPIGLALAYPNRLEVEERGLDFFSEAHNLTFERVDSKVFKTVELSYEALRLGGSYSIALNGANEVLVDKFLNKKIKFIDIQNTLERVMNEHKPTYNLDLDSILQIDFDVRRMTEDML